MKRFNIVVFLGSVWLLIALSGCSLGGGEQPDPAGNEFESDEYPGAMTFFGLEQSLLSKVDDYSWPADFYLDVPAQIRMMAANGEDSLFQVGRDDVILSIANSCAWMEEWSLARVEGDSHSAEQALTVIEEDVPQLPAFIDDGDSGAPFASFVADARLGDPAPINRYLEANCESFNWLPNPDLASYPRGENHGHYEERH